MSDETTQPEITAPPVPVVAPVAEITQPPAPHAKPPDPDKLGPQADRTFNPKLADNFTEIPGAMEYLAEKLGVTGMQIENARLKAERMGFTVEEAAKIPGKTADEILANAEFAKGFKTEPVAVQEAEPPHPFGQPKQAVKPPSNDLDAKPVGSMSYDELLAGLAKSQ